MPPPHCWQGSASAAGVGGYLPPAGPPTLSEARGRQISPAAVPPTLVAAPASRDSAPDDAVAGGERRATREVRAELSRGRYRGCQEAPGNGPPVPVGAGPPAASIPPPGFYCRRGGDRGVDRPAGTADAAGPPFATPVVGAAGPAVVCPASAAVVPIPAKGPADPARIGAVDASAAAPGAADAAGGTTAPAMSSCDLPLLDNAAAARALAAPAAGAAGVPNPGWVAVHQAPLEGSSALDRIVAAAVAAAVVAYAPAAAAAPGDSLALALALPTSCSAPASLGVALTAVSDAEASAVVVAAVAADPSVADAAVVPDPRTSPALATSSSALAALDVAAAAASVVADSAPASAAAVASPSLRMISILYHAPRSAEEAAAERRSDTDRQLHGIAEQASRALASSDQVIREPENGRLHYCLHPTAAAVVSAVFASAQLAAVPAAAVVDRPGSAATEGRRIGCAHSSLRKNGARNRSAGVSAPAAAAAAVAASAREEGRRL